MIALGYLDDAAFARAWIESRDRAHPRGANALRRELRLKGVADEIAIEAIAERDQADQTATASGRSADALAAARLLERRTQSLLRERDPRRRRERAYALLARNGFDPATAAAALTAWIRSSETAADRPDLDDEVPTDP